jgi:hypothetical protein
MEFDCIWLRREFALHADRVTRGRLRVNIGEEQLAFHEWVGRAITQWALVEMALADIVRACIDESNSAAIAFDVTP